MSIYVVQTRYLAEHEAERLAARPRHREWLTTLKASGHLVNAGPFADGSGALLVFHAADEAALRTLLSDDPYPAHTLEVTVVGEWLTLF